MPAETGKIAHIAGALKEIFAQRPNSVFFNYGYIIAVCLAMLQLQFSVVPSTVKRRFSTR